MSRRASLATLLLGAAMLATPPDARALPVPVPAGAAAMPFTIGDIVASDHMVAGCPTMDVAVALNADPHSVSPLLIAKMAQAKCTALAPETRVRIMDVLDSGVVRIIPAGTIGTPVFALGRDFRPLSAR